MDVLKGLNDALSYIEDNLEDELDISQVARIAHCSEYHFKKMFSYLTGITLLEYIRRRRLTLAGFELREPNSKVIDIAIKYGYHPDAFAKTFYQMHGIKPSEAKKGKTLKAYPRMTFQLSIKGGGEMNYRLEEKDSFHIIGIKKRVPIIFQGENPEITAMWKSLNKEKINQLTQHSDVEPHGLIQASTHFSEGRMEETGSLDHYIGVATTSNHLEGFVKLAVPRFTWAIFESIGPFPQTLQETWGRIYSEWFPSSSYEQAEGPEILSIKSKELIAPTVKSEIWIPVIKSK